MQYCAPVAVKQSPYFPKHLGLSFEGRSILAHANFEDAHEGALTLIIGGMHGDEQATFVLLESFLAKARTLPSFLAIPALNPDGVHRQWRYNARGVDLNRNFETNWSPASEEPSGANPWSEPETCLLRDVILEFRPLKIVSLHWALGELDADGPQSTSLARSMWDALTAEQKRPYRLRTTEDADSGGFCPGSLGQWCGYALKYPDGSAPAIVTLELPHQTSVERPEILPDDHLEQLRALWQREPHSYIRAVEPAVDRMLVAACLH